MTHSERDARVGLLTSADVGARLNLPLPAIDHLVATGELSPVPASKHGKHLFWPDDVMAYDLWESTKAGAPAPFPDLPQDRGPSVADRAPAPVPSRRSHQNRPAWPPFTGPRERGPAYLAFADGDHLVSYLRSRKVESGAADFTERPGRVPVKVR